MRSISFITILFAALVTTSCGTLNSRMPEPIGGGVWRPLFDAQNTAGWKMVGPGELKMENGELVTHGGMGLFVYTAEKFGNCQIRVVYKLTATNDNSGVFIRMPAAPETPWDAVNFGYEVQIDNNGSDYHRTGCLYSFTKAKTRVSSDVGEWATMIITLDGKRTRVEVNGQLVTDYKEGQPVRERMIWYEGERRPRPESGYIGLQNHGHGAEVHFKEVSVRPLR